MNTPHKTSINLCCDRCTKISRLQLDLNANFDQFCCSHCGARIPFDERHILCNAPSDWHGAINIMREQEEEEERKAGIDSIVFGIRWGLGLAGLAIITLLTIIGMGFVLHIFLGDVP